MIGRSKPPGHVEGLCLPRGPLEDIADLLGVPTDAFTSDAEAACEIRLTSELMNFWCRIERLEDRLHLVKLARALAEA